jgi:hypothetical protein
LKNYSRRIISSVFLWVRFPLERYILKAIHNKMFLVPWEGN